MVDTNADMTDSQPYIPLAASDAKALAPGFYQIESEYVEALSPHSVYDADKRWVFDGMVCLRGVGGSSAATHSSGSTLTRYYPESPSGGTTLAQILAAGSSGDAWDGVYSSAESAPGETFVSLLYLDTTSGTGGLYAWDGTQYVQVALAVNGPP